MKRPVLRDAAVGEVVSFDGHEGQGRLLADDQHTYSFHCTQIVGGARTIAVGSVVRFDLVAGHRGRWEASQLRSAEDNVFFCAVCASPVPGQRGEYDICEVCGWEDDPVQTDDSSCAGGANVLSLDEARALWDRHAQTPA